MHDSPAATAPLGWRRWLILAFIYVWLAIQIVVPVRQKLTFPDLQYRQAHYAWGMYGWLRIDVEVSLYRTRDEGITREPIPDIEHFVKGFHSPRMMHLKNPFNAMNCAQAEQRFAELIETIAKQRGDDYVYVAQGHWTKTDKPDHHTQWEYRAVGNKER